MMRDAALAPWVDSSLPIPRPHLGSGEIRLVIVGQDPTVQNPRSRASISTVLNLDRAGSLLKYLDGLCGDLGVSLTQNVYATNACKCFFSAPPTTIKRISEVEVLQAGARVWLPVLQYELAAFPDATVVSLGEPVLAMLVRPGFAHNMRDYWGYQPSWRSGYRYPVRAIEAEESTLGRRIYPFVHQPTMRGARAAFYRERRPEYIALVRQDLVR